MEHNRFSPVVAISRYEIRYLRNSTKPLKLLAYLSVSQVKDHLDFRDSVGLGFPKRQMCCEGVTPLNKEHLICYQSVWNWTVTKRCNFQLVVLICDWFKCTSMNNMHLCVHIYVGKLFTVMYTFLCVENENTHWLALLRLLNNFLLPAFHWFENLDNSYEVCTQSHP